MNPTSKPYCVLPYAALVEGFKSKSLEAALHPDMKEGETYVLTVEPKRLQSVQEDIEYLVGRMVDPLSIEMDPGFHIHLIAIKPEMEKVIPLSEPMSLNGSSLVLMINLEMAITHEVSANGFAARELRMGAPQFGLFGASRMRKVAGEHPSRDLAQISDTVPVWMGAELAKRLRQMIPDVDDRCIKDLDPTKAYVVVEDRKLAAGVMAVLQSRSEKDLHFLSVNDGRLTRWFLLETPQFILQGIKMELNAAGTPEKYERLFRNEGVESPMANPARGFPFKVIKGGKPQNG